MVQNIELDVDEQVLALRDAGRSFPAIARLLKLQGATAAHDSFMRALARKPGPEQRVLRQRELNRLEDLSARVRRRSDLRTRPVQERLKMIDELQTSFAKGRL
jgi:hypothetical protein